MGDTVDPKDVSGGIWAATIIRPRLCLLTYFRLKFRRLRQRNDLLNIQQDPIGDSVGCEPNAANIKTFLVEPKDSGSHLFGEVHRNKDDPDILPELFVVWLLPLEKLQNRFPRVAVFPMCVEGVEIGRASW